MMTESLTRGKWVKHMKAILGRLPGQSSISFGGFWRWIRLILQEKQTKNGLLQREVLDLWHSGKASALPMFGEISMGGNETSVPSSPDGSMHTPKLPGQSTTVSGPHVS